MKVHIHEEGYAWVPKMRGFIEDPNEDIWARKASHLCCYASRGKDSFYLGLFFDLWAKKWEFLVPTRCPSPRQRYVSSPEILALHLGEGVHLGKGVVCPGEPGSMFYAVLVRLG